MTVIQNNLGAQRTARNFVIPLMASDMEEAMANDTKKHDLREGLPGQAGPVPASDLVHDRDGDVATRPDLLTPASVKPGPDRTIPPGQTTNG
jgi:hypothetical protein